MNRFLAIGAVALFSFVVAGTAMAQERAVLQEGSSGLGGGFIGSGPGGGIDNSWMRELLSKPETVYGRLWGKDLAGSKVYVETGGGALVKLQLTAETNMENIKAIGVGNDIEVQVKRNVRRLGTGSEAADVPEGDAIALTAEVIRAAVLLQESVGLAVVTDGEFRRLNFQDSFGALVVGFAAGAATLCGYEQRVEGGNADRFLGSDVFESAGRNLPPPRSNTEEELLPPPPPPPEGY